MHILPILTVVTMLLMTRADAAGRHGGPTQRMMMNIMSPLMFGVFTWAAASGLALYWTVGNVIGATQQFAMNKTHLGKRIARDAGKAGEEEK